MHHDSNRLPLQGLRVLVSRPRQQAAAWQNCLRQAGADTLSISLMSIEPLEEKAAIEAIKRVVMNMDHFQAAVFVSQNAVKYAFEWLDRYWPQLPVGVEYFAVGKATANALRSHGLTAAEAGEAMNSEALLALPSLQKVNGKKIAVFRGQGGRPFLGEKLVQRGAQVQYCEMYRRQLPPDSAELLAASDFGRNIGYNFGNSGGMRGAKKEVQDVISVHSGETLANLIAVIESFGGYGATSPSENSFKDLPLLVPGQRVAALAGEKAFKKVIIAENATDKAMLTALIDWYREN